MDSEGLAEPYIDPRCEYDAPTFVDFTNISAQYNDNADEWFDQKLYIEDTGSRLCGEDTEAEDENNNESEEDNEEDNADGEVQVGTSVKSTKQKTPRTTAMKASKKISLMFKPGLKDSETKPKKAIKSTEQLQMEEIGRLRLEAKKRLKSSRRSFQRLTKGSKPIRAVKGSKRPTQIKEFHFSKVVDRSHVMPQREAIHPESFAKTLRSRHPSDTYEPKMAAKKPPTPEPVTRPKPFKFELDRRAALRPSVDRPNTDMPAAEFIAKFHTTTPPRFRRTPRNNKPPAAKSDGDNFSLGSHLTNPKTPKLLTKTRARPTVQKSAAELEEEVALKMKQYQFKATILNPDVIHKGGLLGVPRKRSHTNLTHPVSPQLATKRIAVARKGLPGEGDRPDYDHDEEKRTFSAQPIPDFSEITGLPAKRPRSVTQPESPAITKRFRPSDTEGGDGESHVIKANPMPNFEKLFVPQYSNSPVIPEPFSFEERDKNKRSHDTLVEKNEKPEFKAQPLPSSTFKPSFVPVLDASVTKPKPFNLHTDIRGEQHLQKWKEQIDTQFQKEKREAEFKAKKAPDLLYTKPFSPEKSTRPPTRVDNFVLHSEARSHQRDQYEAEREKRVKIVEAENLRRRALRDAGDAKELADYRKTLVHKANPVQHYAPLVIKPSDKTITEPRSPHFKIDQVLKNRSNMKV